MNKLLTACMFLCILHFMTVLSKSIDRNMDENELLHNNRPKIDDKNGELMDTGESNIVFRPLFAYKHQQASRRRVRSAETDASAKAKNNIEQNSKVNDGENEGEDMEADESSVVFRPLFAYRRQQEARRRIRNQQAQRRNANVQQYPYGGHDPNCRH